MGCYARRHETKILQNAAQAVGNGNELILADNANGGFEYVCLQLTGTFTATVTPEVSLDGTNWVGLMMYPSTDNTTGATTMTAPGVWKANVAGMRYFRARISAYTSGNVTALAGTL